MNNYNRIYEKLVTNRNDYIGMIAYSIYKKDKRDVVRKKEDVDAFVKQKLKSHELERYRKEANELLNIYAQEIADEEFKRIKDDLVKDIERITSNNLNGNENKLFQMLKWILNNGFGGVIGNLFTAVTIIIFFFAFNDSITASKKYIIEVLQQTLSTITK